jgi:hypothetical protein
MSSLLPALIALLTIFAAGFGTSMVFLRKSQRIRVAELAGLSWLFGTIVVSFGLWLLGMTLRDASLHIALSIVCLALAIAGIVLFIRNGRPRLHSGWPQNWAERALVLMIALEIAAVFVLTFKDSLGWDGLLIWELKARYAFLNGGALPLAYFSDATRAYSHPEYPLYLPMLETWVYFWIGDCDQYWLKLIFPVFYAAGVLLLGRAASSWSGRRWIGLLTANLFFFIPCLTRAVGGVINGYADVPLAFFYLAAFCYLSIFARENSRTALAIFVALAAALPWIKRDGVILWLVLASCGSWIIWRRRGVVSAMLSLLPGIFVIAAWQIFLRRMHVHTPREFLSVTPSVLLSNLHRLGPITLSLLKELSTLRHWSLLWLLTIFAFFCLAWRNRSERTLVLFICTTLPIALYCLTYFFSAWPEYSEHVSSSLGRLLLHVAPLALLAIALALAPRQMAASEQPD